MRLQSFLTLFTRATPGTPASITINENNTDVLFMLLAQIKRIYIYTLPSRRTCALIRHTSYRMLVQEIVRQSHHLSDFVASPYNTSL